MTKNRNKHKTHKIRIDPTPEQLKFLTQCCGLYRFAWNWALQTWKELYYEEGVYSDARSIRDLFIQTKYEEFPWVLWIEQSNIDHGTPPAFKR